MYTHDILVAFQLLKSGTYVAAVEVPSSLEIQCLELEGSD